MKETRMPMTNENASRAGKMLQLMSKNSNTPAPNTAGILSKKENLAASVRFNFTLIPATMVMPERDTPGINANACAQPIYNALPIPRPVKSCSCLPNRSTRKNKTAPTTNVATSTHALLNRSSIKPAKTTPMIAAGMLP